MQPGPAAALDGPAPCARRRGGKPQPQACLRDTDPKAGSSRAAVVRTPTSWSRDRK